jgi:hypothetical protein
MVAATEIAGRGCPWCSRASEVKAHDHGHVSLRSKAARKGDLQTGIAEEGVHACRSPVVRPRRGRWAVAWVIPLEVARNLLWIGMNREHESDARYDNCRDEDPRESEWIKT